MFLRNTNTQDQTKRPISGGWACSTCLSNVINHFPPSLQLCLCTDWSATTSTPQPPGVRGSAGLWKVKFLIDAPSHLPLPSSFSLHRPISPTHPLSLSFSRGGVMGACHVWVNQGMMTSLPSYVTIATPANREMLLSSLWLSTCLVSVPTHPQLPSVHHWLPSVSPVCSLPLALCPLSSPVTVPRTTFHAIISLLSSSPSWVALKAWTCWHTSVPTSGSLAVRWR